MAWRKHREKRRASEKHNVTFTHKVVRPSGSHSTALPRFWPSGQYRCRTSTCKEDKSQSLMSRPWNFKKAWATREAQANLHQGLSNRSHQSCAINAESGDVSHMSWVSSQTSQPYALAPSMKVLCLPLRLDSSRSRSSLPLGQLGGLQPRGCQLVFTSHRLPKLIDADVSSANS